jgi:hypothetical protein
VRPGHGQPSQKVGADHVLDALGDDLRPCEFRKKVRISVKLKVNRRRYPWIIRKLLAKTRKAARREFQSNPRGAAG